MAGDRINPKRILRSGSIAAAGLIAFAKKHRLPVPALLAVDGLGSEVYGAYERAHSHYEDVWRLQPEEFARLKAIDVGQHGAERSFLAWLDRIMLDCGGDDFSFGNLYFLDSTFGGDDDVVGGFYRFVAAQTSEHAPPNAAQSTLDRIRKHPAVVTALQAKGSARLILIDDVADSREINFVYAGSVLERLAREGILYAPHDSMFFFPAHVAWLPQIEELSLGDAALSAKEDALVYQVLKGSYGDSRTVPIGVIPSGSLPFDTPAAIAAYARYLDEHVDLIDQLQEHVGIASREELLARLLSLSTSLRAALIAVVNEAEAAILETLRQPA